MKINQIQQVSKIYAATAPKKVVAKNQEENKKDRLELSSDARHFQTALKAAKRSPDIRTEKVAKIKSQIDSGTYNVSAQEVAKKMMADYFDHSV